ncbi:MAG: helix-turn-helix domain-containing protein [Candidatus Nitrosocosmicus sp.]
MHRRKSWACEWLQRYDKEGISGLKNRTKSCRPSEISEEAIYQIKKELKQSNHGWTTKQVEELIIKKSGIKYHYTHIYRILRKWGFKQKKVPRKVPINTASIEEKNHFKKRIVIEHNICRLKKYRIMNDVFRNRLRKYNRISDIVSGLVNYRMINQSR